MENPRRLSTVSLYWCVLMLAQCRAVPMFAAEPQRIISLAPSITETVFALGVGDRLVGVSVYCDYPKAAERIDRVGTFLTPNLEAIIAKRPDIVLAVPSPGNRGGVEALSRLGIRVVVVDPTTLDEIRASILTIGRALDREAAATALLEQIDEKFAAVTKQLGDAARRRTLMVVGQTPLIAVGSKTFQGQLIEMARGTNVAAAAASAWPNLSLEYAIAAAPEVIIDTTMGDEERPGAEGALAFWKAYPTIPAVRDGHVYGYKAYQLLRPGPRIGEAFEAIAKFVHPERFQDEMPTPVTPAPQTAAPRASVDLLGSASVSRTESAFSPSPASLAGEGGGEGSSSWKFALRRLLRQSVRVEPSPSSSPASNAGEEILVPASLISRELTLPQAGD